MPQAVNGRGGFGTDPNIDWVEIDETRPDTTEISLSGPFDGSAEYQFRVIALTGASESAPTDVVTVETFDWPASPATVTVGTVTKWVVNLSWDASEDADGYTIHTVSLDNPDQVIDDVTRTTNYGYVEGLTPGAGGIPGEFRGEFQIP